jgi:hypothetical protein
MMNVFSFEINDQRSQTVKRRDDQHLYATTKVFPELQPLGWFPPSGSFKTFLSI